MGVHAGTEQHKLLEAADDAPRAERDWPKYFRESGIRPPRAPGTLKPNMRPGVKPTPRWARPFLRLYRRLGR